MRIIRIAVLVLVSLSLIQCVSEQENPIPEILSITPDSKVAHLPEFTLTVNGQNFMEESVIIFDGEDKPTTFVSESKVTCIIEPEDIDMKINDGSSEKEKTNSDKSIQVVVRNPAPGGGDSGFAGFTIKENFEFESPGRVFESIKNGWIGPMVIDGEDNLVMLLTEIIFKKYWVTFSPFLVTSEDKGETWEEPEKIISLSDFGGQNLFADDKGNTHIFYSDYEGKYVHLYHRIREKDGAWSEPVRISIDDKGALYNVLEYNSPFVQGNKMIAVWTIITPTWLQFPAYSISEDYGATWTKPVWMKDLWNAIWTNAVITDNGNISLVYAQYERKGIYSYVIDIFNIRSTDNGATWSDPVLISNGAGRSYFPTILYPGTGNDFKVVWIFQKTGVSISGLSSYIDMKNRRNIKDLFKKNLTREKIPDESNRTRYPSFHIRMSSSENNGENWGTERNIVDFKYNGDWFDSYGFGVNIDRAGNINLVVNNSYIMFGIAGEAGKKETEEVRSYYIRSIDGGLNWTSPVYLSDDPELSATFISSDSKGNIYIMMNKIDHKRWYYFNMEPYFTRSVSN